MWHLIYNANELIYKTETDSQTENRLVVAKEEGAGGRTEWEFRISRCRRL